MTKTKNTCNICKAQYYATNQLKCGICDTTFCPNCSSCSCTSSRSSQNALKKQVINLKDLNQVKESQVLEINATLSPLIGQTPIATQNGTILKTEFELSDDHQKVPLIIWGPVPEKLFSFRYEFTNLTISGIKKRIFNGKQVLIASKSTKYYINNLKTKSLNYFISESIY